MYKKLIELNYKWRKRAKSFYHKRINILGNNDQILFDLNLIQSTLGKEMFLPLTNWSMSPSTVLHIFNDIILNKRNSIIEFGLGTSTIYLAQFIKNQKRAIHYKVVESNKEWIAKIQELLKDYELDQYVQIIHAPLSQKNSEYFFSEQHTWYGLEEIKSSTQDAKFDLIIVDGPIGETSPYARYPALPILKENLADEYSIFLDDTFRKEESTILSEWNKMIKGRVVTLNKYSVILSPGSHNAIPFQINTWKK